MTAQIRHISTHVHLLHSHSRTIPKKIPSLNEFIFRQRIKSVYRDLARIVYRSHEKDDLMRFVRDEFRMNALETDINHRRYLLSLGISRINDMMRVMGIKAPEFK